MIGVRAINIVVFKFKGSQHMTRKDDNTMNKCSRGSKMMPQMV